MFRNVSILLLVFIFSTRITAQNFINGDLDGIISGISSLPDNWQSVPYTDPVCTATSNGTATPDLTDTVGPDSSGGLLGNPFSGNTFVSGALSYGTPHMFQEGIMQTVSGFKKGCYYEVRFYQTVVKQSNCLDTSGSWIVYMDEELIGVSKPSVSYEPYNSLSLKWDYRALAFKPKGSTHTIKFLPYDDDPDWNDSTNYGPLRMGIDKISLGLAPGFQNEDFLGEDKSICEGDSVVLDASLGTANYLWQDSTTDPVYVIKESGKYWVDVWYSCLAITDTINVLVNPIPEIDLGNDTSICMGDTLVLEASYPGASYFWPNGSTDSIRLVSEPGTYGVRVTKNDCRFLDDIKVGMVEPIDLGDDYVLCPGEVDTLNASSYQSTYQWQDGSNDSVFVVGGQGVYWVQVDNACGEYLDTISVIYQTTPTINLGKDTTICEGQTFVLNATTANGTYQWQDNSTQSKYIVSDSGTYWVNVYVDDCIIRDTINFAKSNDCNIELVLPNIFTPNGDGENDVFRPVKIKGVEALNSIIYNRWGKEVYRSSDLSIGWGKEEINEPDGTYYWVIEYSDYLSESNILRGEVQLQR